MATLDSTTISRLLEPYFEGAPAADTLVSKLSIYLDLLVRWNGKTNLTAIRDPQEMVQRHFGESLFAGLHLPETGTLLDFGSGAGFPGLPIQLLRSGLSVTLGESQNKKAAFLREAVRSLDLNTEVWSQRVEAMPVERQFDVVTLRAVDHMPAAIVAATARVRSGGLLAILTIGDEGIRVPNRSSAVLRLTRI